MQAMTDTMAGGSCIISGCGAKNPVVAIMAQSLIAQMNTASLAFGQAASAQSQQIATAQGFENNLGTGRG